MARADVQLLAGARAELPERADEVPRDATVAVICGSGYRSSVATSLLKHRGYPNVVNVLGGMSAWQRAGLETVVEEERGQSPEDGR
jgi:hydroxyacylglutathione hydrolase